MGNIYLIDRPFGSNGFALAEQDEEAIVVLIQDGVYLDVSELKKAGRPVYAVQRDIDRRGLERKLAASVEAIGFEELVDLIVEHKVVNFA
jgi:sulfur relay protein TusB/DsrH